MVEKEQGHVELLKEVSVATRVSIGAPTLFETAMVVVARGGAADRWTLSRFLLDYEIETIPFDDRHHEIAIGAFIRYGKGRHPARLNYGDCMTYATAKIAEAPLLFIGDDFAKTDLTAA